MTSFQPTTLRSHAGLRVQATLCASFSVAKRAHVSFRERAFSKEEGSFYVHREIGWQATSFRRYIRGRSQTNIASLRNTFVNIRRHDELAENKSDLEAFQMILMSFLSVFGLFHARFLLSCFLRFFRSSFLVDSFHRSRSQITPGCRLTHKASPYSIYIL